MSNRDGIVAADVKARPVDWMWRERIPRGMITIVAGKPDQGKGLFATRVAADMSKRGENVLYNAIEDDFGLMTRPRLEAAGANLKHVLLWRFVIPAQMDELEQRIVKNKMSLVVMDPFAAVLSGGISRHSDNVRNVTTPLSEMAEATGCAFLIIEHALKRLTKNVDPLNAIGGSGSGLPAAARMAYLFGSDPKDRDRRLLAPVKSNLRERPKTIAFETDIVELEEIESVPALLYQEETEATASVLMESAGNTTPGRPPDKRAAAAEWLTRYLFAAKKPVKASQIYEDAKQFALTTKTVRRAAEDMGVVKDPPGGGRSCTWALPEELVAMLDKAAKDGAK